MTAAEVLAAIAAYGGEVRLVDGRPRVFRVPREAVPEHIREAFVAHRAEIAPLLANGAAPRPLQAHPPCSVCRKLVGCVSIVFTNGSRECARCYLAAEAATTTTKGPTP